MSQRELATPSKSPPPPAPMNNISTSILQHHGADSQAFLNHLQMTWDLHRNMQTETETLKTENTSLTSQHERLKTECQQLCANEDAAVRELKSLKSSNQSVKDEVAAMRKQLERVVGAASKQREANEKALVSLAAAERETQQINRELTSAKSEQSSSKQKMQVLTHHLNVAVEENEKTKTSLEMSQKQQRALRLTEEEMSVHLQRVVDRLQESEKNRAELKQELACERKQQATYRTECDQLKEDMDRLRTSCSTSKVTIETLKKEMLRREDESNVMEEKIIEMRETTIRKERAANTQVERANTNARKMEEECRKYHEEVVSLESEKKKLMETLEGTRMDMENEFLNITKKLTFATTRISEMKRTISKQEEELHELEEANLDASKRQAMVNGQLEKDGLKIRALTEALLETQKSGRSLQEAAAGANKRLKRAIQERDDMVKQQEEESSYDREKEVELHQQLTEMSKRVAHVDRDRKKWESQMTELRTEKTTALEGKKRAEEVLEEMMEQTTATEKMLSGNVQQAKKDFSMAIQERDDALEKCLEFEHGLTSLEKNQEDALNEKENMRVTLEATVIKLEQVTEELGRRIQSEMVLNDGMNSLREELSSLEERMKESAAKSQDDRERSEEECTELERALAKRCVSFFFLFSFFLLFFLSFFPLL